MDTPVTVFAMVVQEWMCSWWLLEEQREDIWRISGGLLLVLPIGLLYVFGMK